MKKPNLFIVGSAKSGTSSLWQHLKNHPDVFMPIDEINKEPAYFSNKKTKWNSYQKYLDLFKDASDQHKWLGEASTAYLTDPCSAKRIYEYDSNVKIIILLRNPSTRAYSLYNWMVQDGYEYVETFEKALKLEKQRIKINIPNYFEPEYYYNYHYFSSGLYFEQIKRYHNLFKDRLLIIKFENYIQNFEYEFTRICDFLDIKSIHTKEVYLNKSIRVLYPPLQFLLRKLTNYYLANCKVKVHQETIRNTLNIKFREDYNNIKTIVDIRPFRRYQINMIVRRVIKMVSNADLMLDEHTKNSRDLMLKAGWINKKPKTLKKDTYTLLKENYRTDIMKLSEYTNIDFSDWL